MGGYHVPICVEGCGLEQAVMYCSLDYLLFVQKFKIVSLPSLNLTYAWDVVVLFLFVFFIKIVNTKITLSHLQQYLFCVT